MSRIGFRPAARAMFCWFLEHDGDFPDRILTLSGVVQNKPSHREGPIAVRVGNVAVKIYRVVTHGYDSFQVADYSTGSRRLKSYSTEREARGAADLIAFKLSKQDGAGLALKSWTEKSGYWLVVFGFKSSGGKKAERAKRALSVVEGLDVIEEGGLGLSACEELAPVDELEFEAVPEALHGGVVIAVAPATHGGDQAGTRHCGSILGGGVLNPPVGVEQQFGWMTAMEQGHCESIHDEWGIDTITHGPADHFAAVKIQDPCEEEPAFLGVDVGDIRDPDLIGLHGPRSLRQTIGGDGVVVVAVRRLNAIPTLLAATKTLLPHEACHAVATAGLAPVSQLGDHARAAIGLAALGVNGQDHL